MFRNVVRFVLKPSVLSWNVVRFVLKRGPFCPETWPVLSGPFCPWSVLSEYHRIDYTTGIMRVMS